nr:flagellar hook-associated protein FlgK [Shouchella xiaoxiensis]
MRRAVSANQVALQTVGNNIANAGTPGYSRQRANMEATPGYPGLGPFGQPVMNGRIGTGVEISKIERIRDQFLDQQFRSEAHIEGSAFMQYRTLERLEDLYNEGPTNSEHPSGLSGQLNAFWNGWKELASGQENQAVLIEQGKAVTDTFTHLQNAFNTELSSLRKEAELKTDQVNDLLEQIAINNKTIAKIEGTNQTPNELYDEQDRLIDQLSTLIPIEVSRETNKKGFEGTYSIKGINNGPTLVNENGASKIELNDEAAAQSGLSWQINTTDGLSTEFINASSGGGELFGLQKAYARIEQERTDFSAIARDIAGEVNAIFAADSDVAFFLIEDNGSIKVNEALNSNMNIDIEKAKAIGDLAVNSTAVKEYQDLMGKLGVETQSVRRQGEASSSRLANIDGNRMAMSSVSLDEELTMLIQYQHSYNAAARVMTAMDEMLNTIINGMGVVGR